MKKITQEQFNKLVPNILALYSKFLGIPENEIMQKITEFNQQLEKQIKENEKSIQHGQDDQVAEKHV